MINFTNPLESALLEAGGDKPNSQDQQQPEPAKGWREIEVDIPADDQEAPGFFRGKKWTVGDFEKSRREAEAKMQAETQARSKAEAELAATQTLVRMLEQRSAPAAAAPSPQPRQGMSEAEQAEWLLEPEKAKRRVIDETTAEIRKQLEAEREKDRQEGVKRETLGRMIESAKQAGVQALTDLKIPAEHHQAVLELVVPTLTNKAYPEFFNNGGPTVTENYKTAITRNPIIRAGVEAILSKPATDATPAAPQAPPGASRAAAPPKAQPGRRPLSDEARRLATALAKQGGVTDAKELQAFIDETAERISANRARRRGSD